MWPRSGCQVQSSLIATHCHSLPLVLRPASCVLRLRIPF